MYMNRKGIQFGYKDTFSLDATLSPIILSALKKFQAVTQSSDKGGIPGKLLLDLFPYQHYDFTEEQNIIAIAKWDEIVDTMIYAFDSKNEPDISKYDFDFTREIGEPDEYGGRKVDLKVTNEEEYKRYKKDSKEHADKVEEGHKLFGEYFACLWW